MTLLNSYFHGFWAHIGDIAFPSPTIFCAVMLGIMGVHRFGKVYSFSSVVTQCLVRLLQMVNKVMSGSVLVRSSVKGAFQSSEWW